MKTFIFKKLNCFDKIFLLTLFISFLIRIDLVNFTDLVQYPYQMPDSWSWLSDGLRLAGYDTQMSYRPPFFPLLVSILYRTGLENLIVLSGQVFSVIAATGVYLLGSRLYNKEIGLYSSVLFLANGSILGWSAYVLADIIALSFMIFAFYFFFQGMDANENKFKYFFLLGILCGLSFLTQYMGLFIIVIIVVFSILNRRTVLAKKTELIYSLLIFLMIVSPWFIYRWIEFGNPFYSTVAHIQLLRFRTDFIWSSLFYIINTIFFAPINILILTFFSTYIYLYKKTKAQLFPSKWHVSTSAKFNLIWIGVVFSFFVFFYYWNDNRFVIYYIIPIIILSSIGIYNLRKELKVRKLNSHFIFIFILILVSANIILLPQLDKEYMVPPVFSPVSGTTGMISLSTPGIEFAFPLMYQNQLKFSNETYKFGLFANIDPFILPIVGQYINANSSVNDVVAIKPIRNDPAYWYIIWNQVAVLTERQTMDMNSLNDSSVKFILIQRIPNDRSELKIDNFTKVNYEWNYYLLYERKNS